MATLAPGIKLLLKAERCGYEESHICPWDHPLQQTSLYILLAKIESFTHHWTLIVYSITSEEFSCCCYLVTKLYLTPWWFHGLEFTRLLCPWNSPGKNTEGVAIPSPGDLPEPGIKPASPALPGGFFTTEPPGKPTGEFSNYLNSTNHD